MKYLILLLIFACSCSGKKTDHTENLSLSHINVNPYDSAKVYLEDIASDHYEVGLGELPNSRVHMIVNFICSDSLIIISDHSQNAVFIFNNKGDLLRKIDHLGNGPGKYMTMSDVLYDPNTRQIEVLDRVQNKIYHYTLSGAFVRELTIKNSRFAGLTFAKAKDLYAFQIPETDPERRRLGIFKEESKVLEYQYNKLVLPGILKKVGIKLLNQFETYRDSIYYMPLLDDKIYRISLDQVKPVYEIDVPEANKLSAEYAEQHTAKDFYQYWKKMDSLNVIYDNHSLYMTDQYISFGYSFQSRLKYKNVFYSRKSGKVMQFMELRSKKDPALKIRNRILGRSGDYFVIRKKSFVFDTTPKAVKERMRKEPDTLLFFRLKDF